MMHLVDERVIETPVRLPTSVWHWFEFEARVAAFEVCVEAKSTKKARPGTIHLRKRLDLRASNRLFGFGCGRKLDPRTVSLGRPKPLNSCLPNARIFISNLLCLGQEKRWFSLVFGDFPRLTRPLYGVLGNR
jgi:hypothetical protein